MDKIDIDIPTYNEHSKCFFTNRDDAGITCPDGAPSYLEVFNNETGNAVKFKYERTTAAGCDVYTSYALFKRYDNGTLGRTLETSYRLYLYNN